MGIYGLYGFVLESGRDVLVETGMGRGRMM